MTTSDPDVRAMVAELRKGFGGFEDRAAALFESLLTERTALREEVARRGEPTVRHPKSTTREELIKIRNTTCGKDGDVKIGSKMLYLIVTDYLDLLDEIPAYQQWLAVGMPHLPVPPATSATTTAGGAAAFFHWFDMYTHLERQRAWSERTFGPGARTAGVVDHIRKELREIEADPADVSEWIDVVILALDGAWRAGFSPDQIIAAMVAKQTKNEARVWPDWRQAAPDKAIEHDRSHDAALASPPDAPAAEGVPRDMTDEMLTAGCDAFLARNDNRFAIFAVDIIAVWQAAWDAAPSPPAEPEAMAATWECLGDCDPMMAGHQVCCPAYRG